MISATTCLSAVSSTIMSMLNQLPTSQQNLPAQSMCDSDGIARPLVPPFHLYRCDQVSTAREEGAFDTVTGKVLQCSTTRCWPLEITARVLTPSVILPPFKEVHFEYLPLSQSRWLQNQDFEELLKRVTDTAGPDGSLVPSRASGYRTTTAFNRDPVLIEMVRKIAERHSMNLRILNTELILTDTDGTKIHYDRGSYYRLWIQLDKFIDNLCLGFGLMPSGMNRLCALPSTERADYGCYGEHAIDRMVWLQAKTGFRGDRFLFHGNSVPHYSSDFGQGSSTQQRLAWVVNIMKDE